MQKSCDITTDPSSEVGQRGPVQKQRKSDLERKKLKLILNETHF
jgi:hypothetical protein